MKVYLLGNIFVLIASFSSASEARAETYCESLQAQVIATALNAQLLQQKADEFSQTGVVMRRNEAREAFEEAVGGCNYNTECIDRENRNYEDAKRGIELEETEYHTLAGYADTEAQGKEYEYNSKC